MTTTPKGRLPRYPDLCDYAEAVAITVRTAELYTNGQHEHEDALVNGKRFSTDGTLVWPSKGGQAFPVEDLLHDEHLREAIKRTAAMHR